MNLTWENLQIAKQIRSAYWFVHCDLQIIAGKVYHPEPPHAQSLFLLVHVCACASHCNCKSCRAPMETQAVLRPGANINKKKLKKSKRLVPTTAPVRPRRRTVQSGALGVVENLFAHVTWLFRGREIQLLLLLFASTKFCDFGIAMILRVLIFAISRSRAELCDFGQPMK